MQPVSVTVEIADLAMAYGSRPLFTGLSAVLRPGRCTVVTGPNGSGKSTLLKIVAGLVRPMDGDVALAADGAGRTTASSERRRLTGYVAADRSPYVELTAAENLRFAARLRGLPPPDVARMLTDVGLAASRADDLVGSFSSGMRQRLKIALARIGEPPLWIWDEPTAMLDDPGRAIVQRLLTEHLAEGGTALVATNDGSEAERWADQRIAVGGA